MAVKPLMTDETGVLIAEAIREKAKLEDRVTELEKNKVDKSSIAQTTGTAEDKVMSQKAVTEELEKKFDESNVVQSKGDDEDKVMSQAAATKEFDQLLEDIGELKETILSTNLYDNTIVMDGKLLNGNPSNPVADLANGILVGYVPVKEGKTYTITNGTTLCIGTVLGFFSLSDGKYSAVCAVENELTASYTNWNDGTGKVSVDVFEKRKATFTVLAGSGITHVTWHITKAANSNTYGAHDGIGTLADAVQVNEGTEVLPYEEYRSETKWKYEFADEELQKQIDDLEARLPEQAQTDEVTVTKSGNQITLKTTKDGNTWTEQVALDGSQNKAFNFVYIYKNGAGYKAESDDICPVNMYSIYRGGNHGYNTAFAVTVSGHGKTEADIGSVWTDSKSAEYLLIRIVDANTLWMLGTKLSNGYGFNTDNPVSPLVHKSGAKNTGSFSFTSVTKRNQILPGDNRLTVIAQADNVVLADGETKCSVFNVSEEYAIIDTAKMYDYIAANAGKCDNGTYYDDAQEPEMLVKNLYQYFPGGLWLIGTTAVAMRDGISSLFYGLTQSNKINADPLYLYVPFSIYDSLTIHPTEDVQLIQSTWREENFPPYKFYQFDENGEGFAVGYCITHGQMKPEIRKDYVKDNHGAYYSPASSKKMYPMAWRIPTANKGDKITGYAFRTPVKITEDICWYSYEIGNDTFIELEVFAEKDGAFTIPEKHNGKRIEVVKKTDNISILSDVVIGNGISFVSDGTASATLRIF